MASSTRQPLYKSIPSPKVYTASVYESSPTLSRPSGGRRCCPGSRVGVRLGVRAGGMRGVRAGGMRGVRVGVRVGVRA